MLFELEGEPERVVRAGEAFGSRAATSSTTRTATTATTSLLRFTVQMLCEPGKPMLTLVDDDELVARAHLRVPAAGHAAG